MEKLTIELLEELGACKEWLDLVKNNRLEGFPLDRIDEVEGDFRDFFGGLYYSLEDRPIVEYNSKGYKIKAIYSNGNIILFDYDSRNNITKKIYYDGDVHQYEYDSRNKMTKEIHSNGDVYQFKYDVNGNMTKAIYPKGNILQYEYDSRNNITKRIYPDGDVHQYEYDPKDNLTKEIFPSGKVHQYEYTHYKNGQLKAITVNGEVILEIPEFPLEGTHNNDVEIALDLHEDTLELLKQAAEITGKSVEDFILDAAISKAVRTR